MGIRTLSAVALSALTLTLVGCPPKQAPEPVTTTTTPTTPDPTTPVTEPEPEPEPDTLTADELRRRLDDAVATLTVGTPEAARRAFGILDRIARRGTDNPYVYYNLGYAHDLLGETAQAERAYDKAIELDETFAKAYLGKGIIEEKAGRTRDAIALYETGIDKDEEDMELRSALIGALRRQGKLEQAITEAKKALAYNSKSLPVYNDLGLVYIDKNDLSMAKFVFLKAYSQEGGKNNAPIRTNLGWTLYLNGEPLLGRKQLEDSYALDARYLPTLVYLSHLYMDDRNYTDAVPLLEEAIRQEPDNYGVMLNLGVAYRGVGKLEESKEMYEKALEVRPSAPEPHLNLGILLGDHFKDYPGAIRSFETYLDQGGDQKELVQGYIEDVEKEQKRAERQKEREAERLQRQKEKEERQRLLREAEAREAASGGGAPAEGSEGQGAEGSDDQGGDTTAPDTPPADGGGDSPWGAQ